MVGQANGIDSAYFNAFIEDGHPLFDRQIAHLQTDALAPGRLGQSLVETECLTALGLGGVRGRVEGDATTQDGGETARLDTDASQAEIALDAADVPETGVGLDQVLEALLYDHIQDNLLVSLIEAGIDDAAHFQTAEIEFGPNTDRAERVGAQMQGPPLSLIARGRAVEGIELVIGRIALLARHDIDVVARYQSIESRDLGQRRLGAHQPEAGAFAHQFPCPAVDFGKYRYLAAILGQGQLLHHADGHPLVTQLSLARQDTVALLKVDANQLAGALILLIEKPHRQQERDAGQQPDRR